MLRPLTIAVVLVLAGLGLVVWGRSFGGWDQAWRVEVGAALGLLGPLVYLEELLRTTLSRDLRESVVSFGLIRRLLPADPTAQGSSTRSSGAFASEGAAAKW